MNTIDVTGNDIDGEAFLELIEDKVKSLVSKLGVVKNNKISG